MQPLHSSTKVIIKLLSNFAVLAATLFMEVLDIFTGSASWYSIFYNEGPEFKPFQYPYTAMWILALIVSCWGIYHRAREGYKLWRQAADIRVESVLGDIAAKLKGNSTLRTKLQLATNVVIQMNKESDAELKEIAVQLKRYQVTVLVMILEDFPMFITNVILLMVLASGSSGFDAVIFASTIFNGFMLGMKVG